MKKPSFQLITRVLFGCGICLLAISTVLLAIWVWNVESSVSASESAVNIIRASTPEPRGGVLEPRGDNTMAAMSVDGVDYVGIIEMPSYGATLPVRAEWGSVTESPCRYYGSVYDGSIEIGATTQKGQYDFYRELSIGDELVYTDMEGNRFVYGISGLRYADHADRDALGHEESDLTLFIKNIYSFNYLIVFCSARD